MLIDKIWNVRFLFNYWFIVTSFFDFFSKITTPYFCFHDRDISPEGKTYVETQKNLFHIVDLMEKKMKF